ncbi:nucleotidyl transferase AbiEii/AbiGii toxin family protein [Nitriliruptoraceae bacterium ZYF776]|nr:nucleotidyl transferase AbiEii/AbiGii toxin family protein [Profundirhabdus halotolerans]
MRGTPRVSWPCRRPRGRPVADARSAPSGRPHARSSSRSTWPPTEAREAARSCTTGPNCPRDCSLSGERRILRDRGGILGDGLHDVEAQLQGVPHALVGGVAVLVHVQGHRVTEDIDSAVRGLEQSIRQRLLLAADPAPRREATVVLRNGVPVDLLIASERSPRRGTGAFREARAHGIRWAIETASAVTIDTDPPASRGAATVPVAIPSALIAMKTVSAADPRRGAKRETDLLDIWRLLADDPVMTVGTMQQLREAPPPLRNWVQAQLSGYLHHDVPGFIGRMANGPGGASSGDEVSELWQSVIEPAIS